MFAIHRDPTLDWTCLDPVEAGTQHLWAILHHGVDHRAFKCCLLWLFLNFPWMHDGIGILVIWCIRSMCRVLCCVPRAISEQVLSCIRVHCHAEGVTVIWECQCGWSVFVFRLQNKKIKLCYLRHSVCMGRKALSPFSLIISSILSSRTETLLSFPGVLLSKTW